MTVIRASFCFKQYVFNVSHFRGFHWRRGLKNLIFRPSKYVISELINGFVFQHLLKSSFFLFLFSNSEVESFRLLKLQFSTSVELTGHFVRQSVRQSVQFSSYRERLIRFFCSFAWRQVSIKQMELQSRIFKKKSRGRDFGPNVVEKGLFSNFLEKFSLDFARVLSGKGSYGP